MKIDFTSLEDVLALKPKGVFRIDGRVITVNRPGEPEETIFCISPGHANQVRQALTDEGLCGLVGDAL